MTKIGFDLLAFSGLLISSFLLLIIGLAYLPKQPRYIAISILNKIVGFIILAIILTWFIWSWFHVISTLIGG